jgi:hypothetical protein
MKKRSTSLAIKKMQIKITLSFNLTPSDWLSMRHIETTPGMKGRSNKEK